MEGCAVTSASGTRALELLVPLLFIKNAFDTRVSFSLSRSPSSCSPSWFISPVRTPVSLLLYRCAINIATTMAVRLFFHAALKECAAPFCFSRCRSNRVIKFHPLRIYFRSRPNYEKEGERGWLCKARSLILVYIMRPDSERPREPANFTGQPVKYRKSSYKMATTNAPCSVTSFEIAATIYTVVSKRDIRSRLIDQNFIHIHAKFRCKYTNG